MNDEEYEFWVGNFYYKGKIIDENISHWIVLDRKVGKVEIPKTAVRRKIG